MIESIPLDIWVLDKAGGAKVLNNNKDEIIKKYRLKKNHQEIWTLDI